MEYIRAFLVGGLICAAVQLLLDRTKLMPGRIDGVPGGHRSGPGISGDL